ncbi:MAG: DHH family phosphoesterase [Clostridia bacterium]
MFDQIIPIINEKNRFVLIAHVSPDGDTLGSCLALAKALEQKGKKVCLFCSDSIPDSYRFMREMDRFQVPDEKEPSDSFEVCIAIDCSDLERTGNASRYVANCEYSINIDHHISNTFYGKYNIVDRCASATGEIVYHLIKAMGALLTKDISEYLYIAITTDTGSFCYENTTAETHKIAADLISHGVHVSELSTVLFKQRSLSKTRLLGQALSTLEVLEDGLLAIIHVSLDMMKSVQASDNDCDGIVNYAQEIEGVELAILIREQSNRLYKISFRTRSYVDASEIARVFGGGGHKRAAGCTIEGDFTEVKNKLMVQVHKNLLCKGKSV